MPDRREYEPVPQEDSEKTPFPWKALFRFARTALILFALYLLWLHASKFFSFTWWFDELTEKGEELAEYLWKKSVHEADVLWEKARDITEQTATKLGHAVEGLVVDAGDLIAEEATKIWHEIEHVV